MSYIQQSSLAVVLSFLRVVNPGMNSVISVGGCEGSFAGIFCCGFQLAMLLWLWVYSNVCTPATLQANRFTPRPVPPELVLTQCVYWLPVYRDKIFHQKKNIVWLLLKEKSG